MSSSENAFYDAILQREHHFYNSVSRGAELVDEIYEKTSNSKHRIILALGILILHEYFLGKNES